MDALDLVKLRPLMARTSGRPDVAIGLLDGPVAVRHPDLASQRIAEGHYDERVRATVFEVRKAGSRVKVILSRTRPQLVQRLFEQEIPEIADGVIEIRAMAVR